MADARNAEELARVIAEALIAGDADPDKCTGFIQVYEDLEVGLEGRFSLPGIAKAILAAGYARRADVLEEAAMVAVKRYAEQPENGDPWNSGWLCACSYIAMELRGVDPRKVEDWSAYLEPEAAAIRARKEGA